MIRVAKSPCTLLVVIAVAAPFLVQAESARAQDTPLDVYDRGAVFLEVGLQMGGGLPAHGFFPDGERVWYLGGTSDSTVVYIVDPSEGRVREWLDVARTRGALEVAGVGDLPAKGLPFRSFEWVGEDPDRVRFAIDGASFVLEVSSYSARPASHAERMAWRWAEPRRVPHGQGPNLTSAVTFEAPSPDGRWIAGVRDHDLWFRSALSPDSMRATHDGTQETGWDLVGAKWSPRGDRLALFRVDRRGVQSIPIVRWTLPGTPVETSLYSRVGGVIPRLELNIIDRRNGSKVLVDLGDGGEPYVHVVGWRHDGTELYVLRMNRLMTRLDLLGVNPNTGASRSIVTEESETFLWGVPFLHGYTSMLEDLRLVHLMDDGERVLWSSERDGSKRLYLYRLTGEFERAVTPDSLDVDLLEFVDEARGWVYFSARALHAGDPYEVVLYRASLDGHPPQRLLRLPSSGGRVEPSRSLDFFMVTRSAVDEPPVLELRRADGSLVRELWRADLSRLEELGWRPPERVTVKALDGETDLHGLLFRPTDFDATRTYPVIEDIYGGPQIIHTPPAMWFRNLWVNQWLAEHGFVVFTLDGPGTPGRGKRFQDAAFGRLGAFEVDEHANALAQLVEERPFMDKERVGIYGHSWGGYLTLRALLTRPDLYKVGVATAPWVDPIDMRVAIEPYMGCLPEVCPEAYMAGGVTTRAANLTGKLLLIHGTRDPGAPFGESMKMVRAILSAGRPVDFLPVPGANHFSVFGPSWNDAVLRYFVDHLKR